MANVNQRVQKHRSALRESGLRPVQIWVPDTRRADFAQECQRQSLLLAERDRHDASLERWADEAAQDVQGWSA